MRRCPSLVLAALALLPSVALAQAAIKSFGAVVKEQEVSYLLEVCDNGSSLAELFHNLGSAPVAATKPDQTQTISSGGGCPTSTVVWSNAPIGLYQSYARVEASVAGPLEVCVGPDLYIKSWDVQTQGASVTYKATVCNKGSMAGKKFRVGFWHDRGSAPPGVEMGDIFKSIATLGPWVYSPPDPPPGGATCADVQVDGGLRTGRDVAIAALLEMVTTLVEAFLAGASVIERQRHMRV